MGSRTPDGGENAPLGGGKVGSAAAESGVSGERARRREVRRVARRRRRLAISLALATLLLVAGALLYRHYFHPTRGETPLHVVIEEGESASSIGRKLHSEGVVTSATLFRLLAWIQGKEGRFRAGHYLLYPGMRYGEVFSILEGGPNHQIRLTIPEGLTLEQTAELVQKVTGMKARDFLEAAAAGDFRVSFLPEEQKKNLEGFLFPKTYELPADISPRELVETLLAQFERETEGLDWSRAEELGVTPYQVIIIASLIEREAMLDRERTLVAAVIYNRLRMGMLLQIDATVQYALPEWKAVLTYEDLKTPSPYNTYLHKGLPPAPICSPGLASIRAALEPAPVDYLYYVATGDGSHFFTADYQEFLRVKREVQGE
ncbi:MAG: endolytic transglycosylase MltG [Actinomycetota bacterium]